MVRTDAGPRRRALAAGGAAVAALGAAVGVASLTGTDQTDAAPPAGATFVRAESDGGVWVVTRSDGTTLTVDPDLDGAEAPGLSPDGRWLSYARGPEPARILTLYLLRSDQTEPRAASRVAATQGFAHQWSPDSALVLVPVADGDVNLVDTATSLVGHWGAPGTPTGFVDDDSLGWLRSQGERGDAGLTWVVTDLETTPERSLRLQVDRGTLDPAGSPHLMLRQASLSPDGSRVAALLANHRGQARVLVFSTDAGELLERRDPTGTEVVLDCPFRWESGSAVLPRHGEGCVVEPG